MSRNYGIRSSLEQDFRKAETEQDLHMQAEIQHGYNQAGLWCIFFCAFGLLCLGWRMGWQFW